MSHVTSYALQVRSLPALRAAVQQMGGIWKENQKTYTWWGESVGDTPLPKGFTKEQLGKCEHAIGLEGVNYEIGVCKDPSGTGYVLMMDEYNYGYGPSGVRADGGKLIEAFGSGLQKLKQAYSVALMTAQAKAKGWVVQKQTLPSGAVKLSMTGVM